jgi:hypothetical protein
VAKTDIMVRICWLQFSSLKWISFWELCRKYTELSMGKQWADHGKPKSWEKNRHIYGRNALLCKYLKIKHFLINWNAFEVCKANVVFMVDIHFYGTENNSYCTKNWNTINKGLISVKFWFLLKDWRNKGEGQRVKGGG